MFEKYGFMTIKKDSILYMLSKNDEYDNIDEINQIDNLDIIDEESKNKLIEFYKPIKEYPILFCNFHPSEMNYHYIIGKYVYHIKLEKDIKILFMINGLKKRRLLSAIDNIIHCKRNIYSQITNESYHEIKELLECSDLDGFFSPVREGELNGFKNVEIGLLNNKNLYSIIDITKCDKNWNFRIERIEDEVKNIVKDKKRIKDKIRLKHWGDKYQICSIERPIDLNLHIRYKKLIRLYRRRELKSGFWQYLTFQVILLNSNINYYKTIQDIVETDLIF